MNAPNRSTHVNVVNGDPGVRSVMTTQFHRRLGALAGAVALLAAACSSSGGTDDPVPETAPATGVGSTNQIEGVVLNDVSELVKEVANGVVSVTQGQFRLSIDDFIEATLVPVGAGTGIVIDDEGHILTNFHVIEGAESVVVTSPDGTVRPATILGEAPDFDLALLEVADTTGLRPIPLGSSSALEVGDPVVAIGNALGLDAEVPTVSVGIISATSRTIGTAGDRLLRGLLQTDAAINAGNSGGPLLNRSGEVVGVNTAIASDAQNVGFSIAIDDVRSVIDAFLSGTGGAYSGLELLDNSAQRAAQLSLSTSDGVVVFDLSPGPGSTGGLARGDVIVEADGKVITSPADLTTVIDEAGPGASVKLDVIRGSDRLDVTIVVGERPVRIGVD